MGSPAALSPVERRAYTLGRKHFERGNVDEAMTHLSSLARTRRDFADVHYMLGILQERRDDLAAAAQSLREALRINPGYTEAMLALSSVYELSGDFERSREIANRARAEAAGPAGSLDPTTRGKLANLQAQLGDALADAGERREAIEAYRAALDRCPTFHDVRFRLAVTLREAGRPDRSLTEFARILRAHPSLVAARVQRALTLYTLGRCDEAVAEWSAVLAAEPEREDATMYLRMVGAPKPAENG